MDDPAADRDVDGEEGGKSIDGEGMESPCGDSGIFGCPLWPLTGRGRFSCWSKGMWCDKGGANRWW